jgi:arginine metabolism regulation protein II
MVYLPRALQGYGDIAFQGTTSTARNALLHTILTIRAYNVAASRMTTGRALDSYNWQEVAMRHNAQSVTYLKACLQSDFPVSKRGKYKEILATIMSMITIRVIQTVQFEIQGF